MRTITPLPRLPARFTVVPNAAENRHRAQQRRRERERQERAATSDAQLARRAEWIQLQRLSPAEADYIPLDYDPAYPYPREATR